MRKKPKLPMCNRMLHEFNEKMNQKINKYCLFFKINSMEFIFVFLLSTLQSKLEIYCYSVLRAIDIHFLLA